MYGIENYGLNIHNIEIHVVDFVRSWGSVSEWSNFGYEDENGHLMKEVAGTGNVTLELFRMKLVDSAVKSFKNINSDENVKEIINLLKDKG